MRFDKAFDIREMMRRSVDQDNLIAGLFEDHPDLDSLAFSYTQEYDDNNYSDYARLVLVNGHAVTHDDEYEDEEIKESPFVPVANDVISACRTLVESVSHEFGYGDHELNRGDYPITPKEDFGKNKRLKDDEGLYLSSYLKDSEIPSEWFIDNNSKWAVYYAMDHGRFGEEQEFKIFAKKDAMWSSYWYAFHVIKGRLPGPLESFFILSDNTTSDDHRWLKKYMDFVEKKEVQE